MGEVYEVEDLELRERVALKTIAREAAASEEAIGRFKREIQLARRISHPNICRIFDIGRHRGSDAADGESLFLTMELLHGESLADRIRRVGRLSLDETLAIAQPVAEALTAAHAAGIVHRDFKSANVLLVPTPGGADRAVVTDFGLARGSDEIDKFAASVSVSGVILGTPAYMAPEQVEGAPVDHRADIFAFGVVLYEMLSGRWPYEGRSAMSIATRRLTHPPTPLRAHLPELSPARESRILRCLAKEPERRPGSAREVVESLASENPIPSDSQETRAMSAPRPVVRRRLVASGLLLLGLTIAAFGIFRVRGSPTRSAADSSVGVGGLAPVAARPARKSLAILGFRNLSRRPDVEWLSTALSEMLGSEVGAGERIRLISGEEVARVRAENSLAQTDSLSPETLRRIRGALGSDWIVIGSYLALGEEAAGRIRLDARIQDTATGESLLAIVEEGRVADLADLVARAGNRLRLAVGAGELSEADSREVAKAFPSSPEAARYFAEGLAKLRRFDALGARELLTKAIEADRAHPLPRAALAEAWTALGYDLNAREEAKRALDLSQSLATRDRVIVEARLHQSLRAHEKAIAIYEQILNAAPDDIEAALRWGDALIASGRASDVLARLPNLIVPGTAGSSDPRLSLLEANAADSLSDFQRATRAARASADRALALGSRLVFAQARLIEAEAHRKLGDYSRARPLAEEARGIYAAVGDLGGTARALNTVANLDWSLGNLDAAAKLHREALGIRRKIGHKGGEAASLNNLAAVSAARGDLASAARSYEAAIDILREIRDQSGLARSLLGLANTLADRGDSERARSLYRESLTLMKSVGDQIGESDALNNLAILETADGDLDSAATLYNDALNLRRKIGSQSGIAETLNNLALLAFARGDITQSDSSHREALAIRRKLEDRVSIAVSLLNLAEVEIARGELEWATRDLDEARRIAAELNYPAALSWSLFLSAELAREKADFAKARELHAEALKIRTELRDPSAILDSRVSIVRLEIEANPGRSLSAASRATVDQARKSANLEAAARALALVALSALESGSPSSASQAGTTALALLPKGRNEPLRGWIEVISAAAHAQANPRDASLVEKLERLATAQERQGLIANALEARFLAVKRLKPRGVADREKLERLHQDATQRGFMRIASELRRLQTSEESATLRPAAK